MKLCTSHSAAAVATIEKFSRRHPQPVTCAEESRTPLIVVNPFDDDLLALLEILKSTEWAIYWWTSCADAMAMLHGNVVPVVLCERDLPDGNWQTLLERLNSFSRAPRFILTARLADERLWAEALNLGAYDLLAKPFDAAEVTRVVSHASCSWRCEHEGRTADAKLRKWA